VVARDGIEPPTPAFSGLDSFTAIIFIAKEERSLVVPKTGDLLRQEWDKILAGQNCLSRAYPALILATRMNSFLTPFEHGQKEEVAKGKETSVYWFCRRFFCAAFTFDRIPHTLPNCL
jgi:hypothetical protein